VLKQKRKEHKQREKKAKKEARNKAESEKRLFVLTFNGDLKASAAASLTEEVTAILTVATPEDEVLVRLYSAGGLVHAYGLASSQLQRIRDKQIPLTVAIDKVAASGGYMMACVANKIIAAPFAIVGSIGVVAQIPNFNRLLKKHDIDYELITAGKYKRTLTVFGENTEEAREKFRQEIDETHELFQAFIAENRPQVNLENVATGEHWYGSKALERNLVDCLMTSEDYLMQASTKKSIYEIKHMAKKSLAQKFSLFANESLDKISTGFKQRSQEDQLL
jgi:serine protease SohB